MLSAILIALALMQQPQAPTVSETPTAAAKATPVTADDDLSAKLLKVKRIYVESFGDDPVARQVQAMVVASLTESKKFSVTENKDRADAVLKGSGIEKTSQELHAYKDSTSAGVAGGGVDALGAGGFGAAGAGISDSSAATETIHEARVSVRLIDKDGDVLWATTQESKGAKYKGASADVADKVVKQLLRDVTKLAKATAAPAETTKQN